MTNSTFLLRNTSHICFIISDLPMSTITFVDIVTFRIPAVDDDAGEVVCVPKVNHPPGVFGPVRVWESAVTSTYAWVGVSVDGPSGWETTTPVSYTLTCGLVVCNISCNNKENKCVLARPGSMLCYHKYASKAQLC